MSYNIPKMSPDDLKPLFTSSDTLNTKISLWSGDITRLSIDAIVNAAHRGLTGGGGIDGAIHTKAGDELMKACLKLNGCDFGEVKPTAGFDLPAKHIFHTVGPTSPLPGVLKRCYENSLNLLVEMGLRTIAFPCISTGHYGYPIVDASKVALRTIREWLEANEDKVDRIIICVFTVRDEVVYEALLPVYFPM
mmetsp:Transcript_27432/g.30552  ORF Transcript_27432/g.30552 Transcript_27432/m.30552 type:complete len:192 (+) Transcript_27432:182-757(+)